MTDLAPLDPDHQTWLATCPSWCAGEQCRAEMPEDRAHQTPLRSFPVVTVFREADFTDGQETVDGAEFELAATQQVPDGDIWVFIGDGSQSIEVSLESARRIHRFLGQLLTAF